MPDPQIKVLRIVYKGIYEDYLQVEIPPKELKVYRISVQGASQGKRIARMKQCPSGALPPRADDGQLPREFEAEVRIQLENL